MYYNSAASTKYNTDWSWPTHPCLFHRVSESQNCTSVVSVSSDRQIAYKTVWHFEIQNQCFVLRCRHFYATNSAKRTRYSGRNVKSTGSVRTRRTGSSWRDWSTSITWRNRALIKWTSTPTSDRPSSVVCRRRPSTCSTTPSGRSTCSWNTTRTRATLRCRGAWRTTWSVCCRRRSHSSTRTWTAPLTTTTRNDDGGRCCRTG